MKRFVANAAITLAFALIVFGVAVAPRGRGK
jgi:hypothetical protein